MAANALRHHLQDEALAAIEATERAGYSGTPTLRVHAELAPGAQSAIGVPSLQPTNRTSFIVLPARPADGSDSTKLKMRAADLAGSQQI